jgi:hypothetical protein
MHPCETIFSSAGITIFVYGTKTVDAEISQPRNCQDSVGYSYNNVHLHVAILTLAARCSTSTCTAPQMQCYAPSTPLVLQLGNGDAIRLGVLVLSISGCRGTWRMAELPEKGGG